MASDMPLIQNLADEVRLFTFARRALAAGLRALPQSGVLAPAYINATVPGPLKIDPTLDLEFWNRRKGRYGSEEIHT